MGVVVEAWQPPESPDLYKLYVEGAAQWVRDQPTIIAFDSETTGLGFHDNAFGFSLAWRNEAGVYGCWLETKFPETRRLLRRVFDLAECVIGHNIKFDAHRLRAYGIEIPECAAWHDTEALAHLEDHDRPKGLKDLAKSVLGETTEEQEEVFAARKWAKKEYGLSSVRDVGYHMLPRGVVVSYAIQDSVFTYKLYEKLTARLSDNTQDVRWVRGTETAQRIHAE